MIRKATLADVSAMASLQESVAEEDAIWGYGADSAEEWRKRDLTWTFLAVVEGKPIGFVHGLPRPYSGECVFPDDSKILEIAELIVASPHRSKGVGRQLMATLQSTAGADGFTHLRVYSAAKRFADIQAFYEACGFTPWYLEMTQQIRAEPDRPAEA